VYDLETSRIGTPYICIYDISSLRVNLVIQCDVHKTSVCYVEVRAA